MLLVEDDEKSKSDEEKDQDLEKDASGADAKAEEASGTKKLLSGPVRFRLHIVG